MGPLEPNAGRRRVRVRARSRRRHRQRRVALAFAATLAAALLAIAGYFLFSDAPRGRGSHDRSPRIPIERAFAEPLTTDDPENARPLYRYSVIPGGAASPDDVARATAIDPVVAAHYALLDLAHLRTARVREPRRVYVSYRLNDRIYWTERRVLLTPNEMILTDGQTTIRARCGNAISDDPMQPIGPDEPDEWELDSFERVPAAAGSDAPPLIASRPMALLARPPRATARPPRSVVTVPWNPRPLPPLVVPSPWPVTQVHPHAWDGQVKREDVKEVPEPGVLLLTSIGAGSLVWRRYVGRRPADLEQARPAFAHSLLRRRRRDPTCRCSP